MNRFDVDSSPPVRGFLHTPDAPSGDALMLAHGAGSNCDAPLLVAIATAFTDAGFTVLRCDLPYRQKRPHGPPFPAEALQDREGLRRALEALGSETGGNRSLRRVFLGGHSYGGRQATILAAEDPTLASGINGLLLLSYPLHPPRRPEQLRTAHFPALRTPALFVTGTRDPFGSLEEIRTVLKLIPAPTLLLPIEGAGHDLGCGQRASLSGEAGVLSRLPEAFHSFFGRQIHPRDTSGGERVL